MGKFKRTWTRGGPGRDRQVLNQKSEVVFYGAMAKSDAETEAVLELASAAPELREILSELVRLVPTFKAVREEKDERELADLETAIREQLSLAVTLFDQIDQCRTVILTLSCGHEVSLPEDCAATFVTTVGDSAYCKTCNTDRVVRCRHG